MALTHNKVDVLSVRVPLELHGQLVQVPHSHLRLVGAGAHNMVTVAGGLDAVAGFGELEALNELDGALDVLAHGALAALPLYRAFSGEPVR